MENLSIVFGIALSADDDASTRTMACHALCACIVLPPYFAFSSHFGRENADSIRTISD